MRNLTAVVLALSLSLPALAYEDERIGQYFSSVILSKLHEAQNKQEEKRDMDYYDALNLKTYYGRDCVQFYQTVRHKPVLRFEYFVGYTNFKEGVIDKYERQALMTFLQEPCPSGSLRQNCGFEQDPKDIDLLVKDVTWLDGTKKRIEFRVVNASLGLNDKANRANSFQAIQSSNARFKFTEAVQNADFIIYSGHSRYGGGPDFYPEQLKSNGESDVEYYRSNRPGLTDLRDALDKRKDRPALLALLSCDSEKHFYKTLLNSRGRPHRAVLTTEVFNDTDTFPAAAKLTDEMLKGACLATPEKNEKISVKRFW